jgi:hypothetical protein
MARKILQAMVLPLLFALLGAGGKTTFCAVLSVIGLEAHHHAHHEDDETVHAGPFCLDAHGEEDHDHEHAPVPCPESCEIQLADGTAPSPVKLPALVEACLPALHPSIPALSLSPSSVDDSGKIPDPPDDGPPLSAPSFTGRFLI